GACAECSYALMKLGRAEEALQQIQRATELDANFSTAWQYRGELEMERGETLSAIESLSHAIEMNRTVTALQKREQCYRRLGLLENRITRALFIPKRHHWIDLHGAPRWKVAR